MNDVDFRYVIREEAIFDWDSECGTFEKVKVLQWRKKAPFIVGACGGYEWTEWQDVRTEEEELSGSQLD